uniref:Uncharacterized protein n=1 Tax=Rhizophora mucronata TaxID=61149 RepID=A0A2P2R0R5_RHIMU
MSFVISLLMRVVEQT